MTRLLTTALSLTLVGIIGIIGPIGTMGCDGSGAHPGIDDDAAVDGEDWESKNDSATRPLGTFRGDEAGEAGELALVVLMSDKSFHRETTSVCLSTPCEPLVAKGTYKLTSSGGTKYIRFYGEDGELIDRYAYRFRRSGGVLELRLAGARSWQKLQHSELAWCEGAKHCSLQGLAQPECIGEFTCGQVMLTTATGHKAVNACDFWCGDRTNNECEQNGGECLPLTLNGCGESAAPASHDCGRAADIICCVPKPECKPRTCLLHCENGYVVDANGCDTCECLPSSVCEPLTCLLYCERGYAKDAAGCDTCECLE